jgi:hypothetical protein
MKRPSIVIVALVSTLSTVAVAGVKGKVYAYEADGVTLIDSQSCPSKGNGTYDYVSCGKAFREKVKVHLCASRGKGNHEWLYVVGDSDSKTKNTARCK